MIQIVKTWYFIDSSTWTFHNRKVDGQIRCKAKKLSSWVKEIPFVYCSEKLCSIGLHMRKGQRSCSIQILIFDMLHVLSGKPRSSPSIQAVEYKIAINSSSFWHVIYRIENFQHISSNKLVVSVKMNADCILTAVKVIGIEVIFHGSLPFGVVDVDVLGSRYFVELKVFSVYFVASVARRIISYHSVVVAIVLSKYRVERILNTKIGIVFKAGRNNAHWQLSSDWFKSMDGIDSIVLEF